MGKKLNLTKQKFNRLTALRASKERNSGGSILWECLCECGNKTKVAAYYLKNGYIKSCGCLQKEIASRMNKKFNKDNHNFKHGDSTAKGKKQRLYRIWSHIKDRCYNQKASAYIYYGQRGIQVFDEWKNDYPVFKKWALDYGYQDNLIIDRIDNDGNYTPENCQWLTLSENSKKAQQSIGEKT